MIGDVIWVDGGARNPKTPTLFQIADVDSGVIIAVMFLAVFVGGANAGSCSRSQSADAPASKGHHEA